MRSTNCIASHLTLPPSPNSLGVRREGHVFEAYWWPPTEVLLPMKGALPRCPHPSPTESDITIKALFGSYIPAPNYAWALINYIILTCRSS